MNSCRQEGASGAKKVPPPLPLQLCPTHVPSKSELLVANDSFPRHGKVEKIVSRRPGAKKISNAPKQSVYILIGSVRVDVRHGLRIAPIQQHAQR